MQQTVGPERLAELGAIFEQMSSYHPSGPHWYLPLIGCDAAHQGNGHGAALMTYALAECDRQNLPGVSRVDEPAKHHAVSSARL